MTYGSTRVGNGTSADAESIAAPHTAGWRSAYAELMPAAYPDGRPASGTGPPPVPR